MDIALATALDFDLDIAVAIAKHAPHTEADVSASINHCDGIRVECD